MPQPEKGQSSCRLCSQEELKTMLEEGILKLNRILIRRKKFHRALPRGISSFHGASFNQRIMPSFSVIYRYVSGSVNPMYCKPTSSLFKSRVSPPGNPGSTIQNTLPSRPEVSCMIRELDMSERSYYVIARVVGSSGSMSKVSDHFLFVNPHSNMRQSRSVYVDSRVLGAK